MTEEFRAHLAKQTYDKLYQDIQPISMIGYSKSFLSWNNIKNLIDWKGLSIVDLGCFHGYFCFRAEDAGAAKATGLDAAEVVLNTTRFIAKLENSTVTEFHQWHDGDPIPAADVTLCLNALHHFSNPLGCLKDIRSPRAIFEIPTTQEPLVASVFTTIKRQASHRSGRVILLAEKQ